VALAWQIAFLIVSRDPARYVALFPAFYLEKILFPVAVFWLYAVGRVTAPGMVASATFDLVWLFLFIAVWRRVR